MQIPAGLTARPLEFADAAAVTDVIAAQELHDVGEVVIEEADIVGDWQRPGFDVGSSDIGVFDGDRLVAYAEVGYADRGDAAVHPDYRNRGLGTQLALWMQDKAREKGKPVIGMPVPQGSPGDQLLEALGYRVRWTSWALQLPAGATVPGAPAAGRVRRARGHRERVRGLLDRPGGRLPRVVRARARHLRGVAGHHRAATGLRALEPARRHGPVGRRRRDGAHPVRAGGAASSPASPPARTSAAAAWPRPCSSTRSGSRPRTARRGPSSRPTPAPVRSASTRRSGCGSARPG